MANISASPLSPKVGDTLVVTYSGSDGGWIKFDNAQAQGYVSAVAGNNSTEFRLYCEGLWKFKLVSLEHKGRGRKSEIVLAETSVVVEP